MNKTEETMMTDPTEMQIPDDVMEAALKAAYKTAHFGGVRGEMTSYGLEAVVNAIATEVAKERERCARIAEAEWVWPNTAAAIRGSVDK